MYFPEDPVILQASESPRFSLRAFLQQSVWTQRRTLQTLQTLHKAAARSLCSPKRKRTKQDAAAVQAVTMRRQQRTGQEAEKGHKAFWSLLSVPGASQPQNAPSFFFFFPNALRGNPHNPVFSSYWRLCKTQKVPLLLRILYGCHLMEYKAPFLAARKAPHGLPARPLLTFPSSPPLLQPH